MKIHRRKYKTVYWLSMKLFLPPPKYLNCSYTLSLLIWVFWSQSKVDPQKSTYSSRGKGQTGVMNSRRSTQTSEKFEYENYSSDSFFGGLSMWQQQSRRFKGGEKTTTENWIYIILSNNVTVRRCAVLWLVYVIGSQKSERKWADRTFSLKYI